MFLFLFFFLLIFRFCLLFLRCELWLNRSRNMLYCMEKKSIEGGINFEPSAPLMNSTIIIYNRIFSRFSILCSVLSSLWLFSTFVHYVIKAHFIIFIVTPSNFIIFFIINRPPSSSIRCMGLDELPNNPRSYPHNLQFLLFGWNLGDRRTNSKNTCFFLVGFICA